MERHQRGNGRATERQRRGNGRVAEGECRCSGGQSQGSYGQLWAAERHNSREEAMGQRRSS